MSLFTVVRPAWRSLRRSPAFTITASTTLVIGIGAAVAIFALVNGVLLRPLPYGDPERLVGAWHDLPGVSVPKGSQTLATYYTYKRLARSIENIGVYQSDAVNLSDARGGSEPQRVSSASITASVMSVLKDAPSPTRKTSRTARTSSSSAKDSGDRDLAATAASLAARSRWTGAAARSSA